MNSSNMNELLGKLSNHATLVGKGIDETSALRAVFGDDIYKGSEHLKEEIDTLNKIVDKKWPVVGINI